mmetsp:Transcript_14608/g.34990  ORF Transcript_14608/g.34990 Transcript_14608/m.34990 type:complete len:237 (-) Transcript_14608:863-1573(-)
MPQGLVFITASLTLPGFKPPAMITGKPRFCNCSAMLWSNVTPVPPPSLLPLMEVSSRIAAGSDVTPSKIFCTASVDATALDDDPSVLVSISTTRRAGTPQMSSEAASMPSCPCSWTMSRPHVSTISRMNSAGWFWNTPTTSGRRAASSNARALMTNACTGAILATLFPGHARPIRPLRSPKSRTARTTSDACSAVTHRLDLGAKMTPMRLAWARQATSASSAVVMPQTLTILVPAV